MKFDIVSLWPNLLGGRRN